MRPDIRIDDALRVVLVAGENVSVRELAAAANLSLSRFSHLFVRSTGILPGQFLRLFEVVSRRTGTGAADP